MGTIYRGAVALLLYLGAAAAGATSITVELLYHEYTDQYGTQQIDDPGSTWLWNGTQLTTTGNYSATRSVTPTSSNTLFTDSATDLTIDLRTHTAWGGGYSCVEGDFGPTVSANICGNYTFGDNFIDESTATWGPGTAASRTMGGDDVSAGDQRRIGDAFGGFEFFDQSVTAEYPHGSLWLEIRKGSWGDEGSERMVFVNNDIYEPKPALDIALVPLPPAALLFGSALGLLSWMRRKKAT